MWTVARFSPETEMARPILHRQEPAIGKIKLLFIIYAKLTSGFSCSSASSSSNSPEQQQQQLQPRSASGNSNMIAAAGKALTQQKGGKNSNNSYQVRESVLFSHSWIKSVPDFIRLMTDELRDCARRCLRLKNRGGKGVAIGARRIEVWRRVPWPR